MVTSRGIIQVPEGRRIFARMTVMENLEMGAFLRSDKEGIKADLDHVFEMFPRLKERVARRAARFPAASSRCWPWAGP